MHFPPSRRSPQPRQLSTSPAVDVSENLAKNSHKSHRTGSNDLVEESESAHAKVRSRTLPASNLRSNVIDQGCSIIFPAKLVSFCVFFFFYTNPFVLLEYRSFWRDGEGHAICQGRPMAKLLQKTYSDTGWVVSGVRGLSRDKYIEMEYTSCLLLFVDFSFFIKSFT